MKHIRRALQKSSLQDGEDVSSGTRWSGIIGTGQSLGMGGDAPLSEPTKPIPGALKLDDRNEPWDRKFDIERPDASSLRVVQLSEPFRQVNPIVGWYPWNIAGKTPATGMAAQISVLAAEKGHKQPTTVHSCVARSGEPMDGIRKGGDKNAYQASMYEAKALTRLAKKAGNALGYDAIILTHGESDSGDSNKDYLQQLLTMQKDYAADLRAITGQDSDPVLIVSQQNSNPTRGSDICGVTQAQWRAQSVSNNSVICAGPKYQYGYHAAFLGGNLHLEGPPNYDRLGEKYGQVFYQTVVEKTPFVPVSPKTLQMVKPKKIKIDLHVPCPPLQFDEQMHRPHTNNHQKWNGGRGFEVWGGKGGELRIESVEIGSDGTSIIITLAKAPPALPVRVAYAMTADQDGFSGGCQGGRVGQVCDSDDLAGASAEWIQVQRTRGSRELRSAGLFKHRALYDIVKPGDYVIKEADWQHPDKVLLDRRWDGETSNDFMYFHHNHRNYLVAFYAQVADDPFSGLGI